MPTTITIPDFKFDKLEFMERILKTPSTSFCTGMCQGCKFGLLKFNIFEVSETHPDGIALLTELPPFFKDNKAVKKIPKEIRKNEEKDEYFIPIPVFFSNPDIIEFSDKTIKEEFEYMQARWWQDTLTQYAPKRTYIIQ